MPAILSVQKFCSGKHFYDVFYILQVQFVSAAKNNKDNHVEIAVDGNPGYGLVCYDDVDVMMSSVLCRSLPDPQFLVTYQSSNLTSYTGW